MLLSVVICCYPLLFVVISTIISTRFYGLVELTEAEELFEKMKESLNEVMADKVPKMQKKNPQEMDDRRDSKLNGR